MTGDFVYARLMRSEAAQKTGYRPQDLDAWAVRAREWAAGGDPEDLPRVAEVAKKAVKAREVFIYFISAAKERNPAAAMALLQHLRD